MSKDKAATNGKTHHVKRFADLVGKLDYSKPGTVRTVDPMQTVTDFETAAGVRVVPVWVLAAKLHCADDLIHPGASGKAYWVKDREIIATDDQGSFVVGQLPAGMDAIMLEPNVVRMVTDGTPAAWFVGPTDHIHELGQLQQEVITKQFRIMDLILT